MITNLKFREMKNRIYTDHKNRIEENLPNSGFKVSEYKYVYEIMNLIKYENTHYNLYFNPDSRIHTDYFIRITPQYKKYLDFIERIGIIEINKFYQKDERSRHYVLNPPTNKNTTEENVNGIINNPRIEEIKKEIIKTENKYIHRQKSYKSLVKKASYVNYESRMLRYYIEFMTIDDEEFEHMIELAINYKNAMLHTKSVDKIYYQDFRYNHNDTNNRLDTNLTNIARPIREYLMQKRGYSYIDIANSQPYILGIIINYKQLNYVSDTIGLIDFKKAPAIQPNELEGYMQYASKGKLYELFMIRHKAITGIELTRDEAKISFFSVMYSRNGSSKYREQVKVFNDSFPTIGKYINWLKSNKNLYKNSINKKIYNKKNANQLFAITMQRIESDFIEKCCLELYKTGVEGIVTVYDAIAVPEQYEYVSKDIIADVFPVEYRPTISVEKKLNIDFEILNKIINEDV